jgi:hypothetical protein
MPGKGGTVQYRAGPEAAVFRAKLVQMGIDLKDFKTINRLLAENVAEEARGRVPVVEGTLKGDIRGGGTKTRAYVSVGRKRIPYAGPIHFGWPARNIQPNMFLYEAMDSRADEVQEVYARRVDELAMRTRTNAIIRGKA